MLRNKVVLMVLCAVFFSPFQASAQTETVAELVDKGWRTIESKYCTILCHPDVDIKKVNDKIETQFYDIFLNWSRYLLKNRSVEEQLAEKFDRIFQKVEKILDMYPRKIHPTVKIYKNQAQLDDAYAQKFRHANEKQIISYYVHKYTTIYTTEQVISQGLLAYEMGHAVVDHYFLILPPRKIQDLLSQYVEMHLGYKQ